MMLKEITSVLASYWPQFAVHLGCSVDYIEETHNKKAHMYGDPRLHNDRCFTIVAVDWGNSEKGTGSRPRNWKTVLDVFRKCAIVDSDLSKLASFEDRLVHGKQY